ncbi:MAG: DNA polymerase III subunit chi [Pseudomonadota bacterium]|nr:DNA polymerase III subunit chi [Pseudomonadota bacterium]
MTEISFYHLTVTSVESALPKLLERVIDSEKRALVRVESEERAGIINSILWTYDQSSFLPHGTINEGRAGSQPIWITEKHENPNKSDVLVVLDGNETPDLNDFERCLEVFCGTDAAAVDLAQARWRRYTDCGYTTTYWQQSSEGRWETKNSV